MRRSFALLATLSLALAAQSSAGEKKDKQAEALALINRARELSDIRAPGSPPFRLQARVRLSQDKQLIEGTYLLIWLSPSQWREELVFPGFSQLRIGGENRYWVQRAPPALPWVVYQLFGTLSYTARLALRPEERVEKIRNRKRDGASLTCVELGSKSVFVGDRELCFEMGSNTLSRAQFSARSYEFKAQAPWGDKAFPRSLRYVEDGKPVVEIDVEEFVRVQPRDASWFLPPSNASVWMRCENAERPTFLEASGRLPTVEAERLGPLFLGPEFMGPMHAVLVYGTVETSGELRDRSVIRSAGKIADQWALDFLERARFRPRMCDGRRTSSEVFVYVLVSHATPTAAHVALVAVVDETAWP